MIITWKLKKHVEFLHFRVLKVLSYLVVIFVCRIVDAVKTIEAMPNFIAGLKVRELV